MTLTLLVVATLVASCVSIALLVIMLKRSGGDGAAARLDTLDRSLARLEASYQASLSSLRSALDEQALRQRDEVSGGIARQGEVMAQRLMEIASLQKGQLELFGEQLRLLTGTADKRMEDIRSAVERQLAALQQDTRRQLDQMRSVVDEKLHATLEKRLGESFMLVSERLEQVHKGLGEMQQLASGVGDLKRVLTNVKTRGTWGEIQLGSLLEQMLAPGQYETNVATRQGSSDRVEFAIRLPGHDEAAGVVYLPIDAKFPQEDYLRLVEAQEAADAAAAEQAMRQLEATIKREGRQIREKYVDPPHTTDFAIMFLPTEGLYAEVVRRDGLVEQLQRDCRVVVAGPTTLAALLNSLQMGFRTLAIERRSSEVWALLGAVKTEFGKFGDILDKTQKKLHEASTTIETAARKSRTIERRLRSVETADVPSLPFDEDVRSPGSEDGP